MSNEIREFIRKFEMTAITPAEPIPERVLHQGRSKMWERVFGTRSASISEN